MTQLRSPCTFDAAMKRIGDFIGWGSAAALVARNERTVRYWSEPSCGTTPTLSQALALDAAYGEAGGEGAPFMEAYAFQLDGQVARREACRRQLAGELAEAAREAGEAQADAIVVATSNASPLAIMRALGSVEEARAAFSRIAARISSFLPTGAGPAAGSTGGPST